jgi:uncharacterized protein involved in outer membrane biogenesis
MKKKNILLKKIILFTFLGLVVVFVAGVLVVGLHLGDIVKAGMERVGPRITQTSLTVNSVNLALLSGSAGVNGLVLGNPEGYQAPQSISVGKASVSLSPGSILSDKIVIHSVEVRNVEITFEGNPLGANNLTKLMDNVDSLTPAADQAATNAPAATTSAGEKKPAKKFEVDDFVITDAEIHADITGFVHKVITVPLPDIHLTDLGKGNDGITAADLTQKILHAVTINTIQALASSATGLGKSAVQSAGKAAGEGVDQVKKGLGGLFGK